MLLPSSLLGDTEQRQHALYAAVAHEYDDVFPRHVADHYLDKRTGLIKDLLPLGGLILDVGCGTGQLGSAIASEIILRTYPCPKGTAVEFYIVIGGGHSWPGSRFSQSISSITGRTTFQIDATRSIWAFFQRFQL